MKIEGPQLKQFVQLDKLWNTILNNYNGSQFKTNPPLGLTMVPFSDPLEMFISAFREKSSENAFPLSRVVTSIDQVINAVKDTNIFYVHKSCAAEMIGYHDVALCIHYQEGIRGHDVDRSIALPGLNYVYNRKAIDSFVNGGFGMSEQEANLYRNATYKFLRMQEQAAELKLI